MANTAGTNLTSFWFEASILTDDKFALLYSWRSSAAIIGAMQLTATDLHFVLAISNLGSKNFETSLKVQSELLNDCP